MVTQRKVKERFDDKPQLANARRLRREQTDAERKFWRQARGRTLGGYKFKRQFPIGPYIGDFVCLKAKVIVELDGSQHAEQLEYDSRRDAFLVAEGYRVLRFVNHDVLTNLEGVIGAVFRTLSGGEAPSP